MPASDWSSYVSRAQEHLLQCDPVMAELVRRVGPFKLQPQRTPIFPCLAEAITSQQLSRKAADTIFARLLALFPGKKFPNPENLLETPISKLREVGLSGAKADYIRDVAAKILDGTIPHLRVLEKLPDQEIIERLTQARGVGKWTAEMVLIFNLGREDVLPVDDGGLQRGFQIAYKQRSIPKKSTIERFGKKWQPCRTAASWYLWRALDAP